MGAVGLGRGNLVEGRTEDGDRVAGKMVFRPFLQRVEHDLDAVVGENRAAGFLDTRHRSRPRLHPAADGDVEAVLVVADPCPRPLGGSAERIELAESVQCRRRLPFRILDGPVDGGRCGELGKGHHGQKGFPYRFCGVEARQTGKGTEEKRRELGAGW